MRDNYFSLMKGIAIIAVIFIHTDFMSNNESSIFSRQLFTFAVSMFFFLSGFFVKSKSLDIKGIKHIIIPYLIWSIIWFTETTLTGSQPITNWKVINSLFFGGAFFPLYFLIVLVEFKLITPLILENITKLTKTGKYKWYKDWMLLITPVTLIILYTIQYQTKHQPLIYAQIFPTWYIMYYLGCLVKFKAIKVDSITALCCLLISIYLMNVETTYIYEIIGVPFWAASQIKISSFFYSISLCLLFISLHRPVKRGIIARLGEFSFGIYILHIPIKKVVELIINSFLPSNNPFWQVIVIFCTIFISWIVLEISNRILPKDLNRLLGLR